MTEFVQFYDSLYGEEENPRFVTEDKVYGFISHQTHRAKLTKKRHKNSTTDKTVQIFNRYDHDEVLELITIFDQDEANCSHFGDVASYDLLN